MLKVSLKQLFLAETVGFVLRPETRMDTERRATIKLHLP